MAEEIDQNPIILFDGVCNLCNRSVQFILRRDKKKKFRFATLQGKKGQEILKQFNLPADYLNSFILADGEKIYTRSTAALRMLKILGRGWNLFYGFMIVPPFIRNALYNMIAKYRYKWFGKKDQCMIPTPGIRERFIE